MIKTKIYRDARHWILIKFKLVHIRKWLVIGWKRRKFKLPNQIKSFKGRWEILKMAVFDDMTCDDMRSVQKTGKLLKAWKMTRKTHVKVLLLRILGRITWWKTHNVKSGDLWAERSSCCQHAEVKPGNIFININLLRVMILFLLQLYQWNITGAIYLKYPEEIILFFFSLVQWWKL